MSTVNELQQLTADDLKRRVLELRESLFQMQLKLRTGTLENPAQRTQSKRDLARVLTVLTQKQRQAKQA